MKVINIAQFVAGIFLIVVGLYATPTPLPTPVLELTEKSQSVAVYTDKGELKISHPDFGNWLTVVWHGVHIDKPYHPNWTSIVSDYKPVVHKLPYGKWEITFTSELTEGLP